MVTPVWLLTVPTCITTAALRSEEHTSELRHLVISYAVFCLKKKKGERNETQTPLQFQIGARVCPPGDVIRKRRSLRFFFFNDTATTEIYTLSLHDALPI